METIYSFFGLVNADVLRSLKKRNLKTRPNASPGVWLSFLVPIAVLSGFVKFPGSTSLYHRTGLFSVGILLAAIVDVISMIKAKKFAKNTHNFSLIVPAVFTGLLLYQFNSGGVYLCMIWGIFSVFPYSYILNRILISCPQSFTFGEASAVTQSLILFLFSASSNIYLAWHITPRQCFDISTSILQIGLLGIILICGIVHSFRTLRNTLFFYGVSAAILVGLVVPMLHVLLDQSPVLWILQILFANIPRIGMVIYWALCGVLAVFAVIVQISDQKKASTIVRKYFHILAVFVYVPGLIQEGCLLYIASGIVFALFVVLELLRVLRMPPLGNTLQDGFSVFSDEKDQGPLALTPIYLLAGCSLPLWLHPTATPNHLLPLLSGVLSVGIGDTSASVLGTWLGKHRWPGGTKKTIEGTLGCILSQLLSVVLLNYLGFLEGTSILYVKSLASIIFTSLVEAKTDQVDNLALPLIMYILLV